MSNAVLVNECPKCHSRDPNQLNEACRSRPFGDPLHFVRAHDWHRALKETCECSEKDAAVCRSMPQHQPEYCRVKGAQPPPDARTRLDSAKGNIICPKCYNIVQVTLAEQVRAAYSQGLSDGRARSTPSPDQNSDFTMCSADIGKVPIWNMPATNVELSHSPSSMSNAETTGAISVPIASEYLSHSPQLTEADSPPQIVSAPESGERLLAAHNFMQAHNVVWEGYFFRIDDEKDCSLAKLLSKYASSSNAATEQALCDEIKSKQGYFDLRQAKILELKDQIEFQKNLSLSKSPCGHLAQFSHTEDGGKHIECLLCERDGLREALLNYGNHRIFCTMHVWLASTGEPICNCGWEEVLARLGTESTRLSQRAQRKASISDTEEENALA